MQEKKYLEKENGTDEKGEMLKKKMEGYTLVEILIVVVVLSIIIAIAVPEILESNRTAKAQACGAAIRTIEAAKQQVIRDYPNAPITLALLGKYLPGGSIPEDPWGVGFLYVESASLTTHPYNGNPAYEPRGNCNVANGYNDAYSPQ